MLNACVLVSQVDDIIALDQYKSAEIKHISVPQSSQ